MMAFCPPVLTGPAQTRAKFQTGTTGSVKVLEVNWFGRNRHGLDRVGLTVNTSTFPRIIGLLLTVRRYMGVIHKKGQSKTH